MGAVFSYLVKVIDSSRSLVIPHGVLVLIWLSTLIVFCASGAWDHPVENIVNEPSMGVYSALFSLAMLITHMVSITVVAPRFRAISGIDSWQLSLMVGAVSGVLVSVHRLAVIAFPTLKGVWYQPITWVLSLLGLAGYIVAIALVNRFLKPTDGPA
ncbi:hypothetical protein ACGE24_07430 [Corynebacterium kroppenstedtii]|uniref:hypothetical protein n=1 Tax=Corynebacterium sp. PCR 32 TaxID=3351342 RepID=UPI0030A96E65